MLVTVFSLTEFVYVFWREIGGDYEKAPKQVEPTHKKHDIFSSSKPKTFHLRDKKCHK